MKLNGELSQKEQAFFIKTFSLMDKITGIFIYVFSVMGIIVSISMAIEFRQLLPLLTGLLITVIWITLSKIFQLYARKLIKSIEETGTTWKGFLRKKE